ncbi:hypothetical protein [Caulobacter hibisci]|uniref:Cell envelope biogenesis protein TolA n=1 Tax=Caulobacter hibisci TaxID=2035993 RepID=A0ABS0SWY2_9CAUL|nr:hypothetical protein [Caulobacter hibisci]MBI1684098.1 hypothetical protein [Caulobacter hibisci]
MAKAARRRLKVFQAQFGFHDSVVAAPSQAAALAAWGIRQNLFAEGRAKLTDDPDAVVAALAHPEVPLRRAVGSRDPFTLDPGLPDLPAGPKISRAKPNLKLVPKADAARRVLKPEPEPEPEPEPAPPKPPPDRAPLVAAEQRLAAIEIERTAQAADLQARRDALEAEALAARRAWAKDRKAAQEALDKARRAYRAEGGEL